MRKASAEAATRVVAWQISQEMERQGISKAKLAELMHASRAQVDRILKAQGNITIETLQRAASSVGRELRLELAQFSRLGDAAGLPWNDNTALSQFLPRFQMGRQAILWSR